MNAISSATIQLDQIGHDWIVVAVRERTADHDIWAWACDHGPAWSDMLAKGELATIQTRLNGQMHLLAARVPRGYQRLFQRLDLLHSSAGHISNGTQIKRPGCATAAAVFMGAI